MSSTAVRSDAGCQFRSGKPISIVPEFLLECFPSGWHPYQELFARALTPHGVHLRPGENFSNRALADRGEVRGVHFHWIEHLWRAAPWWRRPRLLWGLGSYCQLAKRLGKKIVWTVHNHRGHEGSVLGDSIGFRTLARAADLIIV